MGREPILLYSCNIVRVYLCQVISRLHGGRQVQEALRADTIARAHVREVGEIRWRRYQMGTTL